jgi:hypothetical protein
MRSVLKTSHDVLLWSFGFLCASDQLHAHPLCSVCAVRAMLFT